MEPIDIDALRASVVKQGGIVRQLKKDGAPQEEVTAGKVLMRYSLFSPHRSCEGSSGAEGEAGGGGEEAGARGRLRQEHL